MIWRRLAAACFVAWPLVCIAGSLSEIVEPVSAWLFVLALSAAAGAIGGWVLATKNAKQKVQPTERIDREIALLKLAGKGKLSHLTREDLAALVDFTEDEVLAEMICEEGARDRC